jgi:hypothetical protein
MNSPHHPVRSKERREAKLAKLSVVKKNFSIIQVRKSRACMIAWSLLDLSGLISQKS